MREHVFNWEQQVVCSESVFLFISPRQPLGSRLSLSKDGQLSQMPTRAWRCNTQPACFSPSRSNRANSDGSAQFAYYSFANDRGDSPSGYLRRILVLNREQLIYRRT